MILTRDMYKYIDNRLVVGWIDRATKRRTKQGKRVGRNCPISQEIARLYVKNGIASAVREIMIERKISMREAYSILKAAKDGAW